MTSKDYRNNIIEFYKKGNKGVLYVKGEYPTIAEIRDGCLQIIQAKLSVLDQGILCNYFEVRKIEDVTPKIIKEKQNKYNTVIRSIKDEIKRDNIFALDLFALLIDYSERPLKSGIGKRIISLPIKRKIKNKKAIIFSSTVLILIITFFLFKGKTSIALENLEAGRLVKEGVRFNNYGEYENALLHFDKALEIIKKNKGLENNNVAIIYLNYANALYDKGDYDEASLKYKKAENIFKKNNNTNYEKLSPVYIGLGNIYGVKENQEQAIWYYKKALEIDKKNFGTKSLYIVETYVNIAISLNFLGKYEEAVWYYDKALEICDFQKNKTPIHYYANTYQGLGINYADLGKYKDAEKQFYKALKLYKKDSIRYTSEIAGSYLNLGGLKNSLGKYESSINYHKRALELYSQVVGFNHFKIAITYKNLGVAYGSYGKLDIGIQYLEKALKIEKEIFGIENPNTAKTFSHLGVLYNDLADYQSSLYYHEKALEIDKKAFGLVSIRVAETYTNIGHVYAELSDNEKALFYLKKALEIKIKMFGFEHPDVAIDYLNINSVESDENYYNEHIKFYNKNLSILLQSLPESHPLIAECYNDLASSHLEMGNYKKSRELFLDAAILTKEIYGEKSVNFADKIYNIAIVDGILKDSGKAIIGYRKALEIYLINYGKTHPKIADLYNSLAVLYYGLKEYDQSKICFDMAIDIYKNYYTENNKYAIIYFNMGRMYFEKKDFQSALLYTKKALSIFRRGLKNNHPDIGRTLKSLIDIYGVLGQKQEVLKYQKQYNKYEWNIRVPLNSKQLRSIIIQKNKIFSPS